MANCNACGEWFGSSNPDDLCPTCEKALKRLNWYAEPVKRGRWKEIRNAYGELDGWLCKCGREVKSKENYCPNCGAKMDLEE